jgi:hypothetical protein
MRARLAHVAAAVACLAILWSVAVALTGGFRADFGFFSVSSRSWWRPGVIAALLIALTFLLGPSAHRAQAWHWVFDRAAGAAAMVAALIVLVFGLNVGARVAGGADSFGYVSQSYLWLKGDLHIPQPLAPQAPWPFAPESLAPLGYKPGAAPATSVPTYAPGLPMLMAASIVACGACGPFYVGPVFAALLIVGTWMLALRWTTDRLTRALATVLMASSPVLLFNIVAPMSDAATAALWIWCLILLTWPRVWHAALAGLVAGVAILVRPNLVILAFAAALAAELWTDAVRPVARGRRAVVFLIAVAPAVLIVGLINNDLYGSPFRSGYAPFSEIYSLARFPTNLALYTHWLIESQTILVFLAILPIAIRSARPAWLTGARALPALAFSALVCLSYLFYLQFDAWWFLRFFLPVFPLLFILVAAGASWLAHRLPPVIAGVIVGAVVLVVIYRQVEFARDRGLSMIGQGEQRFAAVADYVVRELPANAVIIALQHSGTIAFYSGRTTIRYDLLPHQRIRSIVDWLSANGHRPYLVLEDWEEEKYKRRFAPGEDALSLLRIPVIAQTTFSITVRIFDPLGPPEAEAHPDLIQPTSARSCPGPRGFWGR